MTELLYMNDIKGNYIRQFNANIIKRKKDYVVLDRSAFYPLGGGQPCDTGLLRSIEGDFRVSRVEKKNIVKHFIDTNKDLPEGEVKGILDWEKRYAHMRMHTAQHLISGLVYDKFNARTVGNQIYYEKSRIDFHPINFEERDIERIEKGINQIISKDINVYIYEEDRESLEKKVDAKRTNMDLLPKFIKIFRVVQIGDFDICPCAGTHIMNIKEIGKVKIIKKESKGKDKERITYELKNLFQILILFLSYTLI